MAGKLECACAPSLKAGARSRLSATDAPIQNCPVIDCIWVSTSLKSSVRRRQRHQIVIALSVIVQKRTNAEADICVTFEGCPL